MSRLKIILASLVLFISGSAHAGDLGWAGAASGAGQAMSQSLFMLQNAMQQAALEEQRERAQLERECRQFEAQGIAIAQCPRTQVRYGRPRAEVQGTDAETLRQQREAYYEQAVRETAERERAQQATVQGLKITLEGLNQQRERLNATSDSPQRRQAVWEYIQQACEFQRQLSTYYQRYGIPEPAEQQAIRQRFENQRAEILREQATWKTQAEREAEAARLNARKHELDQWRGELIQQQEELNRRKEAELRLSDASEKALADAQWQQDMAMLHTRITAHKEQVAAQTTQVTDYNQRYGITLFRASGPAPLPPTEDVPRTGSAYLHQAERAGDEQAKTEYQHKLSYQSRLADYQQLMAEKRWLDQQKEMLEKDGDSPEHQQAITEYNREVLEYHTRLTAFNQRKGPVSNTAQQKSRQQAIEEERIRTVREGDLSPEEGARAKAAINSRAADSSK